MNSIYIAGKWASDPPLKCMKTITKAASDKDKKILINSILLTSELPYQRHQSIIYFTWNRISPAKEVYFTKLLTEACFCYSFLNTRTA